NTPITCSILAIELFGWPIALPAAISCYISYCFAGREGIYRAQKIRHPKHHGLKVIIEKIAILLAKLSRRSV
ncbi:MAG: voltage-gated chloride channel protein, partial [Bdellovibrionota bacterium]